MATLPALFAVFGIGGTELLIILAIVLLLFGGTKLPSLAKGLGQSIKEFKEGQPRRPGGRQGRRQETGRAHQDHQRLELSRLQSQPL